MTCVCGAATAVLCSVLSDAPKVFPADLGNVSRPAKRGSTVQVVEMDDADNDVDDLAAAAATLALDAATKQPTRVAAAPRRAGETYVSVQITKIGLKDAPTYTNPTVVVSVFGTFWYLLSLSTGSACTHRSTLAREHR